MILKALYDYYHRCDEVAPAGWEYREIAFLIVINENGDFIRIEDCRIDNKRAMVYLVPKAVIRSGKKFLASNFWDNVEYVLNYSKKCEPLSGDDLKDEKKIKKRENDIVSTLQKFEKMKMNVNAFAKKYPEEKSFTAVNSFYEKKEFEKVYNDELWKEIKRNSTLYVSFRIDGASTIVAENPLLVSNTKQGDDICLVSGKRGKSIKITSAINFAGSQARIVSFKDGKGYDSYGKEQCANAPISKESEFAFSTALSLLLSSQSKNKFKAGDRTFLFWASSSNKATTIIEEGIWSLFGRADMDNSPDERIELVRNTFLDVYSGKIPSRKEDCFYFLGLAPNKARIAVVYWNECPLKEFAALILKHFEDTEIIHKSGKPYQGLHQMLSAVTIHKSGKPYQGLHQMLSAAIIKGKSSEVQPNLPEAVMKSILQGLPYPSALYQACIRRIRAEQDKENREKRDKDSYDVNATRASILKGYLNRINDNKNKKLIKMLDKNNQNIGYLCGRLFATLVKIQEDANGINTIKERYMNAASSTPATVFATILNLSVHHSEKLNEGKKVFYEKLKQEILEKMSADAFPAHLDLNDQGRFFVGYYHQRQEFFTIKSETIDKN